MEKCYEKDFDTDYIIFGNEDECIKKSQIIIAVGGDGTILKCSLKASRFSKPILGINCGRLGFMASLEHSQLELLTKLATGDYSLSRRMMLDVTVKSEGKETLEFSALNDVVVTKSDDCKIADFEVSKDSQVISYLRADGVIFSTATGATAYSMSAGGPIIEPEMECIEFTQICPHSLFARSMILSADSRIGIKCHTNSGSHALVTVDGNVVCRLDGNTTAEIVKSKYWVEIIDICGGSFFNSVNSKLMRPLKDIAEENVR
jgi:NAD+ kinase